ncbi:MAG TPA: hypothetical protein P5076_24815, partial [Myxococcota bacterium]|nr:hypothetical protein [Myxococcota bacterium]
MHSLHWLSCAVACLGLLAQGCADRSPSPEKFADEDREAAGGANKPAGPAKADGGAEAAPAEPAPRPAQP